MTDKAEFTVTVKSPHGKRAIESFHHWILKVADEAKERWGIEIDVEKASEQAENETNFRSAAEQQ